MATSNISPDRTIVNAERAHQNIRHASARKRTANTPAIGRFILAALLGLGTLGAAFAQPQVAIQPPNLSGSSTGKLTGQAGVSPSGASTYTIPIAVPPGSAGLVPAMNLNYSSQTDRGLLGHGWNLGGLSSITRCAKTIVADGAIGGVTLSSSDQFCVDGQRLRLVSGTHGASAEYRSQIDTFSQYISTGSDTGHGPDSWSVKLKGGLIMTYGGTPDSTIVAAGKTTALTWALSRVQDRRGNYFDVKYQQINGNDGGSTPVSTIEYVPIQIRYTGNTGTGQIPYNAVNFVYETRPDVWSGYVAGTGLKSTQRMTAVRTYALTATDGTGGALVREYRIAYATNAGNGRSMVANISDCNGSGVCLAPTTFTWTQWDASAKTFAASGSGDWGGPPVNFLPLNATNGSQSQQVDSMVIEGDVNGDGAMDLISSDGSGNWKVCLGGPTAFSCQSWTGPPVLSSKAVYGDFNGDGRLDVALPPAAGNAVGWNVCLSTGSSFNCSIWTANSVGTSPNSYLIADIDGDGRDDLIVVDRRTPAASTLCKSNGNGFASCVPFDTSSFIYDTSADPEFGPRLKGRVIADFDGDGRADIMADVRDGGIQGQTVYRATDSGLPILMTTGGGSLTTATGSSHTADLNGDPYGGYSDIVPMANAQGTASQVCRSKGTFFSCDVIAGSDSSTAQVMHLGDADGDGRIDLYMGGAANTKVCQIGQSAPYNLGPTYGGSTNVTCTAWPTATPNPIVSSLFGDFNGDGYIDRAFYIAATSSWNVQLSGNGGFADLLSSVVDGVGHETQFTYRGSSDSTVYTRGADVAYPKRNVPPGARALVSEQRESNGLGGWLRTNVSYQGQRVHLQGYGALGFEKVISVDQTTGITTTTSYSQDFPYIGLPTQIRVSQANGVVLSQTDFALSSFATAAGAVYSYTSGAVSTNRDLDNSLLPTVNKQVNTGGIDAFGNLTSITESVTSSDGDVFTTVTTNAYDNLTSSWLIGLLRRTSVAKTSLQAAGGPATASTLTLSNCVSAGGSTPSPATMTCSLGNSGQSIAASIAYSSPGGTSVSGPGNCVANNSNCGSVTVTTGTAAGNYSGTLTATPSPSGGIASTAVSLLVSPPAVVIQPGSANWGVVGASSDSGDWLVVRNNSSSTVLITGHSIVSGPSGMASWQGQSGYCQPGSTVLAPGATCTTFFGSGSVAATGAYTATDQISFQVAGATSTTYTVQQNYSYSIATTTPSVGTLAFANVAVNTTSATQTFSVTNNATNGGPLKNLAITVGGAQSANFPMTTSCGSSLAAGSSCTVSVAFNPTGIANGFNASIQVQGSYSRMQAGTDSGYTPSSITFSVPMSGNGQGSTAILTSPATLTVPATWYGAAAQTVSATYRNDGNSAMTLASPSLTAPLSISSNSCTGVAPSSTCTMVISTATNVPGIGQSQAFSPSGANVAPASTTIRWTTQSAVPRWSTTSLTFGNVAVGASASQNVTLYNDGNTVYNWSGGAISNQPSGYSVNTGACSGVAAGGGSCNVVVTFSPPGAATYAGSGVSMAAASYNTNTFAVTGTGYTPPNITGPSSLSASSTAPAAATTQLYLQNTGPTATNLSLSVTGGITLSASAVTCGASVGCGPNVTLSSPTTAGTYSGTVSMTSSAGGSVPSIPITLTVAPTPANTSVSVSPSSIVFGAIAQGASTKVQNVTVSNTGSAPAALNWSITGNGNSLVALTGTCVSGAQLAAGSSCSMGLQINAPCFAGNWSPQVNIQGGNYSTVVIAMTGSTNSTVTGACH